MSHIGDSGDTLRAAWSALQEHWAEARSQWRDPVADRFETEFWLEWQQQMPALLRTIDDLDQAVDQASCVLS